MKHGDHDWWPRSAGLQYECGVKERRVGMHGEVPQQIWAAGYCEWDTKRDDADYKHIGVWDDDYDDDEDIWWWLMVITYDGYNYYDDYTWWLW